VVINGTPLRTSLYSERLYLRRRGLKYGMILQRYGLVEGTPHNEASSLLLRYDRRPCPFLRPEGFGRRDVFLQFAMLLYLVGAVGYQAEPLCRR